jgi:hypothetical protein
MNIQHTEEYCLFRCDAMHTGRKAAKFWKDQLSPHSGYTLKMVAAGFSKNWYCILEYSEGSSSSDDTDLYAIITESLNSILNI